MVEQVIEIIEIPAVFIPGKKGVYLLIGLIKYMRESSE